MGWSKRPGQLGLGTGANRGSMCGKGPAGLPGGAEAFVGPGTRAAIQRRQTALRLEERRRREAQAYQLTFLTKGLGREGRAFVP